MATERLYVRDAREDLRQKWLLGRPRHPWAYDNLHAERTLAGYILQTEDNSKPENDVLNAKRSP